LAEDAKPPISDDTKPLTSEAGEPSVPEAVKPPVMEVTQPSFPGTAQPPVIETTQPSVTEAIQPPEVSQPATQHLVTDAGKSPVVDKPRKAMQPPVLSVSCHSVVYISGVIYCNVPLLR
jgi:hypothetical protein